MRLGFGRDSKTPPSADALRDSGVLARGSDGRFASKPKSDEAGPTLTPGQVQIAQYLADGKRNEDIALLMNTSEPAVRNQIARIKDLTGCATAPSIVSWAMRRNLIK